MRLNQVTVMVRDIDVACAFYVKLGLKPIVKSPHYMRFMCPEGDSTFSIHLGEGSTNSSTVIYFENDALDLLVEDLKGSGLQCDSGPTDERWLWREVRLRDPSGNPICLFQAGSNRFNPPWRLPESL
ncbi:MAG: VOC family protein [Burkholderiales bacterium]|nr:VOC family protein [Burkholderiales bacterium]